ncbi:MAG: hypothetical protein IPP90_21960 [Gemmatimonadaceae bacterium]|nr:hypothetical protein [Gemmatimonadaceae bacterium]
MRERFSRRVGNLTAALLCSIANVATAQAIPAQLSAAQAQQDLDVARKSLEEAHGALYRFTPKPELDRKFDTIRARANRAMSRREFFGLVNELLAATGDGHARVDQDDSTTAELDRALRFPLNVVLEGTRLMVTANAARDDSRIKPGMEITSINGHRRPAWRASCRPSGVTDSSKRGGAPPSAVRSRFATGSTSTRRPGLRSRLAHHGVNTLGRPAFGTPAHQNSVPRLATIAEPPRTSAALCRRLAVALLKIRAFVGTAFRVTDSAVTLAIDRRTGDDPRPRGNGGGTDMFGAKLVSHFTDKPFRYSTTSIATIAPSFATWLPRTFASTKAGTTPHPGGGYRVTRELHEGVAEQPPAARPFLGKLVVLIDGGTFSTSADVTAVLRSMNRATFIGEETGGAYEGNTSGLNASVILPNSRFKVFVQMYGYVNAVRPGPKGRGTLPDIEIARTTEETLRGVDGVTADQPRAR